MNLFPCSGRESLDVGYFHPEALLAVLRERREAEKSPALGNLDRDCEPSERLVVTLAQADEPLKVLVEGECLIGATTQQASRIRSGPACRQSFQAAFATGRSPGFTRSLPWLSFAEAPGGRAIGIAPVSRPDRNRDDDDSDD